MKYKENSVGKRKKSNGSLLLKRTWEKRILILLITFFKDVLDETACSLLLCTSFTRCFSIKIKMIYYIILYFYLSRQ